MSDYVVRQLPAHTRSLVERRVSWSAGSARDWLATRAFELSFTAWDLSGLGREWGESMVRFDGMLTAENDAAFFHLYGIERDDVDYVMDTFPIVKRKDEAAHGDYRTKLQILEIYDAMQQAIDTGEPYRTLLDPPPADLRVAHPESSRPEWAESEQ